MLKNCLLTIFISLIAVSLYSQTTTKIVGKVYDSRTKEALSFVDVYFEGTYVGTSTDLTGKFVLQSRFPSDTIVASFIGYELQKIAIDTTVRKQTIDFYLKDDSVIIEEVTIKAKKGRYKKKDNPAVELMRKVIANRDRNKIEAQEYYSYDKHEKLELDLNNITEQFKSKKYLRNFDFLWEYLDTSKVNGKVYLPIYIREILASVHYRKDPETKREIRKAVKMTNFDEAMDMESLTSIIDLLYQDVNIYENSVKLLDNDFLSPLAPWSLNYYRFYLQDTTYINGKQAVHLAFIPRNTTFIGFTGDLFISNDDRYTVLKADLGITRNISMNFVRDIKIVQEFREKDSTYLLTKDDITLDISLSDDGMGMYATRQVAYDQHDFNPPPDNSVFDGLEDVKTLESAYEQDNQYWANNRISQLDKKQEGIYEMIDTLRKVPAYKKFIWGTKVATTGFIPAGPIDIGNFSSFVSRNDIEGWRFRLGGETAYELTKKFQFAGYGAYGLKDEEFKYRATLLYSFKDDFRENPKHYLFASYRHDVVFPGLKLEFIEDDNFLTSFRRGVARNMLFIDSYNLDYVKESDVGFYKFAIENRKRRPYGDLTFNKTVNGEVVAVPDVTTAELGFSFEFSPNTSFIQGRKNRTPIQSNSPRFQFSYQGGFKLFNDDYDGAFKAFDGDYNYHRLSLTVKKRISMSVLGRSETEFEVGGVFGSDIPYILLFIPRANQAYSFQPTSFNMMNFLEFVTDRYVRINVQHFLDGYVFNRIPLWRKLKLKEVVSFKAVYGSVRDTNNPNLNEGLIQFPVNALGEKTAYILDGQKPYIEYGFGIYNIFRFFRVDLIKRVNYLDHPNVQNALGVKGLGIRGRVKVEF